MVGWKIVGMRRCDFIGEHRIITISRQYSVTSKENVYNERRGQRERHIQTHTYKTGYTTSMSVTARPAEVK